MAEKTKYKTYEGNLDESMEFDEYELQNTMEEFLEEKKKSDKNLWNIATLAGLVMLFMGLTFMIQYVLGLNLGPDLSGVIEVLPIIGGILVTAVGFGFLVGDRKERKRKKKMENSLKDEESFKQTFKSKKSMKNDLDEKFGTKSSKFDSYALKQSKRLFKSRTDKKVFGVCGGLAKYFGVSSTMVRFGFVVATLLGWGAAAIIYIGLAIALKKEPPELMDDFDY